MQPAVSVIIPAFNAGAFIGATLESVFAQEIDGCEIIVVDDGSTDRTPEAVAPYADRVRYIRQENGGPSRARNRGILEARGKFIAFLDADDLWDKDKLSRQIAFLEKHAGVGFCFSDGILFSDDGEDAVSFFETKKVLPGLPVEEAPGGRLFSRKIHQDLLYENFILTSSVVIRAGAWPRREAFGKVVYFDETLFNGQDYDLWFRLASHVSAGYIPDVLIRKRRHPANISARTESVLKNRIRLRETICRAVEGRPDVSDDAKSYRKDRLQAAYVDLARWYLVRGDARSARRICREAARAGFTWAVGTTWLFSLAGNGLSRWLGKKNQKRIQPVDAGSKRGG